MNAQSSRALFLLVSLCCGCSIGEDKERYSAQFGEVRTDMEKRILHIDSRPLPMYFGDAKSEAGKTCSRHPQDADIVLTLEQIQERPSFEEAAVYVAVAENPVKYKIIVGSAFPGMMSKDASYVICGMLGGVKPIYFYTTINNQQLKNLDKILQATQESHGNWRQS